MFIITFPSQPTNICKQTNRAEKLRQTTNICIHQSTNTYRRKKSQEFSISDKWKNHKNLKEKFFFKGVHFLAKSVYSLLYDQSK